MARDSYDRKDGQSHVLSYVQQKGLDGKIEYQELIMRAGLPLDSLLKQRTLSLQEQILIARDLLNQILFMQKKGLTHNDIKPANIILIMKDEKIVSAQLADYGLARNREVGDVDSIGTTTTWESPELTFVKCPWQCGENPNDPYSGVDYWFEAQDQAQVRVPLEQKYGTFEERENLLIKLGKNERLTDREQKILEARKEVLLGSDPFSLGLLLHRIDSPLPEVGHSYYAGGWEGAGGRIQAALLTRTTTSPLAIAGRTLFNKNSPSSLDIEDALQILQTSSSSSLASSSSLSLSEDRLYRAPYLVKIYYGEQIVGEEPWAGAPAPSRPSVQDRMGTLARPIGGQVISPN